MQEGQMGKEKMELRHKYGNCKDECIITLILEITSR